MEITGNVVLLCQFMDEARRKGIKIDLSGLAAILGIPVIGTSARDGLGLEELKRSIYQMAMGELTTTPLRVSYGHLVEECLQLLEPYINKLTKAQVNSRWLALRLLDSDRSKEGGRLAELFSGIEESRELSEALEQAEQLLFQAGMDRDSLRDHIVTTIVTQSESISQKVYTYKKNNYNGMDRKIDRILTSKTFGIPLMLALLSLVFWITIQGANYPSQALTAGFTCLEAYWAKFLLYLGCPEWLYGLLVHGLYRSLTWVISVMLPPMAIFFPLFTFLEDLGYPYMPT